jgi:hypothetical protein
MLSQDDDDRRLPCPRIASPRIAHGGRVITNSLHYLGKIAASRCVAYAAHRHPTHLPVRYYVRDNSWAYKLVKSDAQSIVLFCNGCTILLQCLHFHFGATIKVLCGLTVLRNALQCPNHSNTRVWSVSTARVHSGDSGITFQKASASIGSIGLSYRNR